MQPKFKVTKKPFEGVINNILNGAGAKPTANGSAMSSARYQGNHALRGL